MPNRWRDWLAQAEHDLGQATASHLDGRHDWSCFAAQYGSLHSSQALDHASAIIDFVRKALADA